MSSDFNIKIKNLFVALCHGVAGIEPILKHEGFRVFGVEQEFLNSQDQSVTPEIILTSIPLEYTLLIESKSGGNINEEQYGRYTNITENDLLRKAFIEVKCKKDFDISYVVPDDNKEKAKIAFDKYKINLPLVAISDKKLFIYINSFSKEELNVVFKELKLNYENIPLCFIPFDGHSDDWLIATKLTQYILKFLKENRPYFTTEDILSEVFNSLWSRLGKPEKKVIKKKVNCILSKASIKQLKEYISIEKRRDVEKRNNFYTITYNPFNEDPSKIGVKLRHFKKINSEFIEELKTGTEQMDLFIEK